MSQVYRAGNKIYDMKFEFHILSSIIYKNIQEGELNAPIMRAWKTRFTAEPPASKNRKSQR